MPQKNINRPLVSILCETYNHHEYISQALNSFLAQETSFPFEIIVHDDASSDGTIEILRSYQKQHPDIIHLVIQKNNLFNEGFRGNVPHILLPLARGKYIALCEGDDYWNDPQKLQIQVEYMEANPSCSVLFHPVVIAHEQADLLEPAENKLAKNHDSGAGEISPPVSDDIFPNRCDHFEIKDLVKANFIQTNSVMYRKLSKYDFTQENIMPVDWYLHLYHAQFGLIGFIDRVMAVYRIHKGGIWANIRARDPIAFMQRFGTEKIRFHLVVQEMFSNTALRAVATRALIDHLLDINAVGISQGSPDFFMSLLEAESARDKESTLSLSVAANLLKYLVEKDMQHNYEISDFLNSTSWRITKPLRTLAQHIKTNVSEKR